LIKNIILVQKFPAVNGFFILEFTPIRIFYSPFDPGLDSSFSGTVSLNRIDPLAMNSSSDMSVGHGHFADLLRETANHSWDGNPILLA
jgi:hypothetical protein